MPLAKTLAVGLFQHGPEIISVETDIARGLYSFSIVGLGDRAVEESRERITLAIKNSGITPPKTKNQKIVTSLAPASLKKEGSSFDLAIAVSYLKAAKEIHKETQGTVILGELSLGGNVCAVKNIIPLLQEIQENIDVYNIKKVILPFENRKESQLLDGFENANFLFFVKNLKEAVAVIEGNNMLENRETGECNNIETTNETAGIEMMREKNFDFESIVGQEEAKRALIIAITGGHNIILSGPPGSGKTILAKAAQSIMPNLSKKQSLETTALYSQAHQSTQIIFRPPFRAPHHTSPYSTVIGGAINIGEISLAHNGLLFLDELNEFDRRVLEGLREPLEEKCITLQQKNYTVTLPARFSLIGAINPCPCGFKGDKEKRCICSPHVVDRYSKKLSGPFLDRIDIWCDVPRIYFDKKYEVTEENIKHIEESILSAQKIQKDRCVAFNLAVEKNGDIPYNHIKSLCPAEKSAILLLKDASKKLMLSPRAYHKVLKVARTIADLEECLLINNKHILEALSLRKK